jgi:DNA-directed RNA polymerase beta subunit
VSPKHKVGKKSYIGLFPGRFDRKVLDSLDDRGVIKPGATVEYGQPLVLAAKEKDRAQNKIHKKRQPGYSDESIVWEHSDPGTVTDVVWGPKGPVVLVKATSPMQIGDKLSGVYGDKGTIAAIVPDDQMPHDKDGKPFEVLLSPDGVITRANPSQTLEAALGKIAAHTGKPVTVPDFNDTDDLADWVSKELRKHNLKSTEDVFIPGQTSPVANVGTGMRFMMKLHHTAESKAQGRDSGAYSTDETPAKGGDTGCFVGATLLRLEHGVVSIQDVFEHRIGSRICSVPNPVRITDWFYYRVVPSELVTLRLANDEVVHVTKNHEFLLADGTRKRAGDLQVGDDLLEHVWTDKP